MKSIQRSEEATRAILATLLLLGIFSVSVYYVLTTPEEIPIEASKLVIVKPSEIPIGNEVELTIKAISDEGLLDTKRDDLIKIYLEPNSHAQIGYSETSQIIWSNSLSVRLENGLTKIKFIDPEFERIRISVEWIEGKSQLDSVEVQLYVGYRVSQIIGLP
jgi:tetrahydromethanopterin S-methyltransferase subunit F